MKTTDYNVLKYDDAKGKLINITLGYGFDNFDDAKALADEEFAKTGLSTAVRADYYDFDDELNGGAQGQEIVYTNVKEGLTEDIFDPDATNDIDGEQVELDLVEAVDADTADDADYYDLLEKLEENENEVECKICFGLFPKADCIKIEHGFICPACNQELKSHQGTNLDLVDADPMDLTYDDPRITKVELAEPENTDAPVEMIDTARGKEIAATASGKPLEEGDSLKEDYKSDAQIAYLEKMLAQHEQALERAKKIGDPEVIAAIERNIAKAKEDLDIFKKHYGITEAKEADSKDEVPEKFEDQMDFLAADEQEAIDGYQEVIDKVEDDHVKDQLEKIETEEEAHKDYLEKVKDDPTIEYTEPLEQEDDLIDDGDEDPLEESIHATRKDFNQQLKALTTLAYSIGITTWGELQKFIDEQTDGKGTDDIYSLLYNYKKSLGPNFQINDADGESINEDLGDKEYECIFDGKVIGTVMAQNEEEAYGQMEAKYPEYPYGLYDGVAEVRPLTEAIGKYPELDKPVVARYNDAVKALSPYHIKLKQQAQVSTDGNVNPVDNYDFSEVPEDKLSDAKKALEEYIEASKALKAAIDLQAKQLDDYYFKGNVNEALTTDKLVVDIFDRPDDRPPYDNFDEFYGEIYPKGEDYEETIVAVLYDFTKLDVNSFLDIGRQYAKIEDCETPVGGHGEYIEYNSGKCVVDLDVDLDGCISSYKEYNLERKSDDELFKDITKQQAIEKLGVTESEFDAAIKELNEKVIEAICDYLNTAYAIKRLTINRWMDEDLSNDLIEGTCYIPVDQLGRWTREISEASLKEHGAILKKDGEVVAEFDEFWPDLDMGERFVNDVNKYNKVDIKGITYVEVPGQIVPKAKADLSEHINDRPADIESDQKQEGTDNAVVDCKTYTLVAHSEDEKPVDCKMEKAPLEKPLTEAVMLEAIEKEVDLDKKLALYNEYIDYLTKKIADSEKNLLKTKNELIADDIKAQIEADKTKLDSELPNAIKDAATEATEATEEPNEEKSEK